MAEDSANKRVAKNTLLMYFRMLLLLVVSLYTSRVVLAALGFDDYGIYTVVGSVVAMFTFLNAAMSNATSRYITYSLGRGDRKETTQIFNIAIIVHAIIALLIVLLAETIGLWFLYNKAVIPPERFTAALWAYQFSIISCAASIMYIPFNSTIIAHERMGAFASISIIDAILKLAAALLITKIPYDRLIFYSLYILIINLWDIAFYLIYCIRKFDIVRFEKPTDMTMFRDMFGFAGWSLIGNLSFLGYTQGLNIILNIFFGPIVNAARGIAMQIHGVVKGFVTNFQIAVNPQITKAYAKNDFSRLHTLIYASSKISYFLLLCIALPVAIESKILLHLWLGKVPEYTSIFVILTLATMLVEPLSNPIGVANDATGDIKRYQIIQGCFQLLIVPVAYFAAKYSKNPISVFLTQLIFMWAAQALRLSLVCHKIQMSIVVYLKKIIARITITTVCSAIIPVLLYFMMRDDVRSFFIISISSLFSVLIFTYIVGLDNRERKFVNDKVRVIVCRLGGNFKKN